MCGICGIWNYKKIAEEDKNLVQAMNSCQVHRGPDDEGEYSNSNIALGHRRLAIIDLTSGGHQPMHYKERYWIVYNGEIFNYIELKEELIRNNYTFSTTSDTEVVCAAYDYWGTRCFEKFNGFWSMAIYDEKNENLCLARDRYGVKPLYYYKEKNRIVFASEIKAILCDSRIERKVNNNVIADYLVYGLTDCSEETFFKDIYAFPVASYSVVNKGSNLIFEKYYTMEINYELNDKSLENEVPKFKKMFEEAVKLRLRSDVEIGACLSGGLDSSAIVCQMNNLYRKEKKKFKTFSVCFEGFKFDESEYIDDVLNYTGIVGEKITPTAQDFWRDLDELIYFSDQPFASAGAYLGYSLMKSINEKGIKVLMDGQGADEILCGYRKSRLYLCKSLIKKRKYLTALKEISCSLEQFKTSDNIYLDLLKGISIFVKDKNTRNVFIRKEYSEPKFKYIGDNFIYNDIAKISLPMILRAVDRNSMAFSIEDRLPFLDYRLVDYAISLPLQHKIKNGWSKYIMRKSLELPRKVKYRKTKIGFVPPEEQWMKELNEEIYSIFSNPNFKAGEYIDRDKIIKNWSTIIRNPIKSCLFRFICLEKWMEIYGVQN